MSAKRGIFYVAKSVGDPKRLWEFIKLARERGEDPKFWRGLRADMIEQGATAKYAAEWVKGLKALTWNRWSTTRKKGARPK